jgi:hypothetical protein
LYVAALCRFLPGVALGRTWFEMRHPKPLPLIMPVTDAHGEIGRPLNAIPHTRTVSGNQLAAMLADVPPRSST